MFSHAQFLLIKHKKIFEYFSCFWKVFCFCKNFKNSIALFWRLGHGSVQLHAPSREHHSENIHDSLASQSPSREKYLENFSKSGFLGFSWLSGWKLQSWGLHRNFRNFLTSGTSSCEKHLDKFFKNFLLGVSRLVLATCLRLNSVAKNVCFAFLG